MDRVDMMAGQSRSLFPMSSTPHSWQFFRAGGFDQVKLETGADLLHLDQLDFKLWAALACPVQGLEFDRQTLAMIDTDKDGRVRAPELIEAIRWAGAQLKDPEDLVRNAGSDTLSLQSIQEATLEGRTLATSARGILDNLGKKEATTISLADTLDTAKIFAQTAFNGDGIIVPESAVDRPEIRKIIEEILATQGSLPDRSGRLGIDLKRIETFMADCAAYVAWMNQADIESANIRPLGTETTAAYEAYRAVKSKVDDYFGRCRLAAYDSRASAVLNRKEEEYIAVASKELNLTATEVTAFPLARVAAGQPLSLQSGINPAWVAAMNQFQVMTLRPLMGPREQLTESDWIEVGNRLAAHQAWLATKKGNSVESLGIVRIREILALNAGPDLLALVARDKAEEASVQAITQVERLIRYHRDLYRLCQNFVNFKDLYDGGEAAIFQAGVLFLDQRSCSLCLQVTDITKHATMAALAGSYLAYCECVRKGSNEKMTIVAAFTDGDSENLMVGRNGIFYDRKGRDYDATILRIIDNPISLRQAFWSPYKKFVRMVEEQISKRAAAAEADSTKKLAAAAEVAAHADKKVKPQDVETKMDVGSVAALAVAFGAIGGFCTTLVGYMVRIVDGGYYTVIGSIIGAIFLISGPSVILAYIKLRKRNLGPLLDANGWAVNCSARINVPFGTALTGVAKLPPGSTRDIRDPFAEKHHPWKLYVTLLLALFIAYKWYVGDMNGVLPEDFSNRAVLGRYAPKPKDPASEKNTQAAHNMTPEPPSK